MQPHQWFIAWAHYKKQYVIYDILSTREYTRCENERYRERGSAPNTHLQIYAIFT
jgi:hypothetical protein